MLVAFIFLFVVHLGFDCTDEINRYGVLAILKCDIVRDTNAFQVNEGIHDRLASPYVLKIYFIIIVVERVVALTVHVSDVVTPSPETVGYIDKSEMKTGFPLP